MIDRKVIVLLILCFSLSIIFVSMLQIQRVVEPVVSFEMYWDKPFPSDSEVLSDLPDGLLKVDLFGTYFNDALIESNRYSVDFLIEKVDVFENFKSLIPAKVTTIEKSEVSDVVLGDVVSDGWVSWQGDDLSVDLDSYPVDGDVNKSLVWDLNYGVFNPGFHQIGYSFSVVEDWSGFDGLVFWVKGDFDLSLLSLGVSSDDGSVGWYWVVDHVVKSFGEWDMVFVSLDFPDQGSFDVSSVVGVLGQYYVEGSGSVDVYLSNFYLADVVLGDVVSDGWVSWQGDDLSVDLDSYPVDGDVNKSLVWDLNYGVFNPGFHQIGYSFSVVEDWSGFDGLVFWVKGDFDLSLLSLGVSSDDGSVGWYWVVDHVVKSFGEWDMVFVSLDFPDQGSFDVSSVVGVLGQYYVEGSGSVDVYLSNFYLADVVLGDVVSDSWVSWQGDDLSVDLDSYPVDGDVNKSLVWDLNYGVFNPGFHQIGYSFSVVEDWSGFDGLVFWVKGDFDLSLLSLGVSSDDGSVGWYWVVDHVVKSFGEWDMVFVSLDFPDQGSFDVSSVVGVLGQYYVEGSGSVDVYLSNFHFAKSNPSPIESTLKIDQSSDIPKLISQIRTNNVSNDVEVTFEIPQSKKIDITENSNLIVAGILMGNYDFATLHLGGYDGDGNYKIVEFFSFPNEEIGFLDIIRLRSNVDLADLISIDVFYIEFGSKLGDTLNVKAQFVILKIIEGIPTINGTPLDSALGGTLFLRDISFPHNFSWTVLHPLEIFVVSTIHDLNTLREITLFSINSTWQISYPPSNQTSRILTKVWFNDYNEAPIISGEVVTSLPYNNVEKTYIDYAQDYFETSLPFPSKDVKMSIVYNYWPSPYVELFVVGCEGIFLSIIYFLYKKLLKT